MISNYIIILDSTGAKSIFAPWLGISCCHWEASLTPFVSDRDVEYGVDKYERIYATR